MSPINASYSFLPWLRQGISRNISQADGDANVKLRASIPIEIVVGGTQVNGTALSPEKITKEVFLYGPGDVIGIETKAIIKQEPKNWITNFEPNYLPYIDFYEEDFPWRYSPVAANGQRLKPWLTLVVLKEDEFIEIKNIDKKPLASFKLNESILATDVFPNANELWAWAHVHVNKDLSDGAAQHSFDQQQISINLQNTIKQNPDRAYARILSPRKLTANAAYHAFLIPTFESGRLAGLGLDIDPNLMASKNSWEGSTNQEFPYYHRWFFRTGDVGDFEYLVNLLQPKLADKSIGYRDMDVLHPGINLPGITNSELNGVLKLGGALRVPLDTLKDKDKQEVLKYEQWDESPYPHAFSIALADRINLSDQYLQPSNSIESINQQARILLNNGDADPDPVITVPLYGRWHALQQRLLKDRDNQPLPHQRNWVHELNLDPRYRAAAGIGTQIIQKNQEQYMHAAWEQIGKVVELNNKIKWAQLALYISQQLYKYHFVPLTLNSSFLLSSPIHNRILQNELTVKSQIAQSIVPKAMTSGKFRQIIRPRGHVMKRLNLSSQITPFNIIERVNNAEIEVLPAKRDPSGGITANDIPKNPDVPTIQVPSWYLWLKNKYPKIKTYVLYVLLFLLALFIIFPALMANFLLSLIFIASIALFIYIRKWDQLETHIPVQINFEQQPSQVDQYPKNDSFKIGAPGEVISSSTTNQDSKEAQNFKIALKESLELMGNKWKEPVLHKLPLKEINEAIIHKINPHLTIKKRTEGTMHIPERIRKNFKETFTPVMAYPEFDLPMYKPLVDLSSDLFLPNIHKIEENSITLLENNQKFIESYMVGINHEMSRELLWREYLTDQRGSYFRQFWDVKSYLVQKPIPVDIKEKLKDIPEIHTWSKTNNAKINLSDPDSLRKNELGTHNQRAAQSGKTQLVLVIRGELLKKYPNAVIYAHKADWGIENGQKSVKAERDIVKLSPSQEENPPEDLIKTPIFEAKVDPDLYFFGFDLDDEEARGTINPTQTSDHAGWFFMLKERPGEPRFGLDIDQHKLVNWNNLSWKDLGLVDGQCIQLNKSINLQPYNPVIDQENKPIEDDQQAQWNSNTDSSQLAYILYQVPVMVAVHASRMLPK